MTTPARENLMLRSNAVLEAADERLRDPRNVAKGDEWRDYTDLDILKHAAGELQEIAATTAGRDYDYCCEDCFRSHLMQEIGDLVNDLRFLADKYHCLPLTEEVRDG